MKKYKFNYSETNLDQFNQGHEKWKGVKMKEEKEGFLQKRRRLMKEAVDWSKLGDLSYSAAIQMLDKGYRNYIDAENLFKGLEFGYGGFEKWFESIGKKITSQDVRKLDPNAIGNLLANIFYNNTGGLKKMVSDNVLLELIDKYVIKDPLGTADEDAQTFDFNIRGKKFKDYFVQVLSEK